MSALGSIRSWGRMVKFSHSVFALPFALASATAVEFDVCIIWARLVGGP